MKTSASEIAIIIGLIMIDCAVYLQQGAISALATGGLFAILWGIGKAFRDDMKFQRGYEMKLAWLCYDYEDRCYPYNYKDPVILFEEPLQYLYDKVVPIVYAEIVK